MSPARVLNVDVLKRSVAMFVGIALASASALSAQRPNVEPSDSAASQVRIGSFEVGPSGVTSRAREFRLRDGEGQGRAGASGALAGGALLRDGHLLTDLPILVPPAPWSAPIASAILPGAGQALLRQPRALAYVVAEAFLVIRYERSRRDFVKARNRYRELASDVARASFGSVRPVGPWEYYESMEKYLSSGIYDANIGGQFTPETDTSTFNGKQWELARGQYWENPDIAPALGSQEYESAVRLYKERAVKDSFQWTWRDNQLYRTDFQNSIKEANSSSQSAVTAIGFVAANHLVSLIDAYVTVRLRRYGGAGLSAASVNTEIRRMGNIRDRHYGMALNVTIPVAGLR